jgi:hypothetical protein
MAVGVGVMRGFGTGVTRTGWTIVTRGSNAEVEPRAVSVGALGDGNAVSPATSPVGLGWAVSVGDALEGAALGAGDPDAPGVGDPAGAVAPGAPEPVGVEDGAPVAGAALGVGCAAVSPPSEGPDAFGPPNAPTASAIPARTRFRIPRATTSRARWAIVTNDRHSSSGRALGG